MCWLVITPTILFTSVFLLINLMFVIGRNNSPRRPPPAMKLLKYLLPFCLISLSCQSPSYYSTTRAHTNPSPTPNYWQAASATATTQRELACSTIPKGCFAIAPGCIISICSCVKICLLRNQKLDNRAWRKSATECVCK